ncbi:hypothetical protein NMY22_g3477 [Coprinellus aureogranulatus]|nr:hypothetical protein NMY22_g3477 [Coprinellus aureogranulatus]
MIIVFHLHPFPSLSRYLLPPALCSLAVAEGPRQVLPSSAPSFLFFICVLLRLVLLRLVLLSLSTPQSVVSPSHSTFPLPKNQPRTVPHERRKRLSISTPRSKRKAAMPIYKLISAFLTCMNSNTIIELMHCIFHEEFIRDSDFRGVLVLTHLLHSLPKP